jgi:hypothetical protein
VRSRSDRIASYLLAGAWPLGQAAIAGTTVRAALRARQAGGPATRPGGDRVSLAVLGGAWAGAARRLARLAGVPDWVAGPVVLGACAAGGGVVAYRVMELLGPAVLQHGPPIDERIVEWTNRHRIRKWAAVSERLGKIGNTWTTWGASGAAGVCLAVSWRSQRWLPPVALGYAVLVDHYATLALRYRFGRLGPPGSPGGTYPSGGCDRVVFLYGLVAYLLWREFSGTREGRAWATGAVAALAFNEAYTREYLSKHWFTDIVTGLFYGGVLLAPFLAAVRGFAGPATPSRTG